jgi:DNA (cytosine-5)-methyltransferase 1
MSVYYNEFDNHAAEWLRNLIAEKLIADGDVDNRPIQEVTPNDLQGYTQAHFFAGIGGWSYALRLAGWPDERPVWTGSCPCQAFSVAGKREGASDERHLWPNWFRLIEKCQPPTVFGEQVAGAIGFGWLDAVATDFESQDYAFASAILSGFTVGAHHKRQRLWFVADTNSNREKWSQSEDRKGSRVMENGNDLADSDQSGREAWIANGVGKKSHPSRDAEQFADESAFVADTKDSGRDWGSSKIEPERKEAELHDRDRVRGESSGQHSFDWKSEIVADTQCKGLQRGLSRGQNEEREDFNRQSGCCSAVDWEAVEWVECHDKKTRPIPSEPNVQPLVNGIPKVLDREGNTHKYSYANTLKGIGNAIIPQVGAEFIRAYVEVD